MQVGIARRARRRSWILGAVALLASFASGVHPARAFRIIDAGPALTSPTPVYVRWDAAPRTVVEEERSLDGGLRYSVEGGSYSAFRDQFTWSTIPTVSEFQAAVERSFAFWTAVDPATGLGTSLSFVPDFGTEIYDDPGDPGNPASWIGVNSGAEIDLIAAVPDIPALASAIAFVDLASFHDITLTSGTTGYAGFAISGSDIRMTTNYAWDLPLFETILTHEIGHAIGFADFPQYPGVGGAFSPFLDDDYDGTSSATALATLTNSFALAIDPYDPDSTALLKIYDALSGDPGLNTPGVRMLMEELFVDSMSNNEFAGRQFLYPVPEPASTFLLAVGAAPLVHALRRRARRKSA